MTTKKSASDWANQFGRPSTAPTEEKKTSRRRKPSQKAAPRARKVPAAAEAAEQLESVSVASEPSVADMVSRRAPAKRPVTYRLTDEILDLVDAAVFAARKRGEKLTKEEAVAVAIRRAYARLVK